MGSGIFFGNLPDVCIYLLEHLRVHVCVRLKKETCVRLKRFVVKSRRYFHMRWVRCRTSEQWVRERAVRQLACKSFCVCYRNSSACYFSDCASGYLLISTLFPVGRLIINMTGVCECGYMCVSWRRLRCLTNDPKK